LSKHKKHNEKVIKEDEEDISLDISKFKNILSSKKTLKILATFLFILIPIILSVFLRIQPAYLPATEDWARNSIYTNVKQSLNSQISAQYPNLPADNKNKLINDEFQKILEAGVINMNGQNINIEDEIKRSSDYFKTKFQNENGQTYLLAIDPYFYYRMTRNVVNNGNQWDYEDENGKYHDTKILGGKPLGEGSDIKIYSFHTHLQYYFYKIARLFNPNVDLMAVVFLTPLIIGALAVIPAFFLTRKVAGDIGGFFAGLLIAIHPAFLTRTAAGFSDTDAYNVFFPLIIIWLFMESLDAKTLKNKIILTSLTGLNIGLFSYAWGGWFFILTYLVALIGGLFIYYIIKNFKTIIKNPGSIMKIEKIKSLSIVSSIFAISTLIFISLISTPKKILSFVVGIIDFTQIKDVGTIKIWPNVYTTVAELNPASLGQVISQISLGSKLWLFIGFIGIVLSLTYIKKNNVKYTYFIIASAIWYVFIITVQKSLTNHLFYSILISIPIIIWVLYSIFDNQEMDIKYTLILLIWFASTIYAGSKGVRFILLLVPAFSIACGIAVGKINQILSNWISKELHINKIVTNVVIIGLFFALLLFPTNFVKAGLNVANNEIPSMNDDWYGVLTKIRDESQPDAIINSWWDFGHWFAAIGERAVTLDGGRQNNPQAHWLGKLMLTWDEAESIGILRYLDCGSNTGYDTLLNYMNNESLNTINTIYEIINSDKDEAKTILSNNGLNEEQINDVLQYTHCNPPENYFITSEDMVGKSGVWAHFGAWDFTRAVMFNQVIGKEEIEGIQILTGEPFNLNDTKAKLMYNEIQAANADQWISPWPSYASGLSGCSKQGSIVTCQTGLVFNLDTEEATVPSVSKTPKAISFIDKNGNFKIKEYDNNYIIASNGRPLGASLIPVGNNYQSILMDYELTGSMFTRLFYYGGYGLKHFNEFNNVRDVTGSKIITWKVDWEGNASSSETIIEEATTTKPQTADFDADSFSKCLSDYGANFYGTKTCSWCLKQKELLNSNLIPHIDCEDSPEICSANEISSYPTWIIDDKKYVGFQTLEQLSGYTGCEIQKESTTNEEKETPEVETTKETELESENSEENEEYSLVKIQHITIEQNEMSDLEALNKITEIHSKISNENFDEKIDEHSECSDDTLSCNLGWFGKGVLPLDIENVAFSLKQNEISKPFKSKYGYHIIKLIDTKQ
jgi:dolichyl-phosphooligosaccharide-protein glycotransferase